MEVGYNLQAMEREALGVGVTASFRQPLTSATRFELFF